MKIHFNYLTFLFLLLSGSIFAQTTLDSLSIKASFNFGKSVAVFGGSVSVIPESDSAKVLWEKHLGLTITNYGVPGAGFSSLQGKSMQQQVDEAGVFDIYILWASTNDYTNNREVGSYTDYTEFDNYNAEKLTTQAGGINYCIKKIYEINPNATIYFFTSSKAFNDRGAYDPFYTEGMVQHVDMQKMICELHGIPVLDQFLLGGYNIYNKDLYYRDPIHMNVVGYKKLGELQVSFLAFP
ncbi:SGNH/GDSL hydrolase family protein [Maribacter arcticus]|uniref:GDSL-like Lipase/Acylhydrolase n=1 Tax=Maribacter arcticus TaxID=561365 RepID=A0A1T5A4S2_9FLAO|nr:SGNH/GDSL hydrolase family protein [Maribacter arcticus]SKB30001.1 GDSL-like Lipase/Acylhydrolase [Maribacter arcticus]|tara:strand:- start:145 stop:861 length:717 start_codon:yes stop_codon:yes gene_type:complete